MGLQDVADAIIQQIYDSTYHPALGETWIYLGQRVRIVGGYYWSTDPKGQRTVSNYWHFRYVSPNGTLGEHGSTYDNDRSQFYNPEREQCFIWNSC